MLKAAKWISKGRPRTALLVFAVLFGTGANALAQLGASGRIVGVVKDPVVLSFLERSLRRTTWERG
jgi:hypothetical protein